MKRTRLNALKRKEEIGLHAFGLAKEKGLFTEDFSVEAVAARSHVSAATVRNYFGNQALIIEHVINLAIAFDEKEILDQARVMKHPLMSD